VSLSLEIAAFRIIFNKFRDCEVAMGKKRVLCGYGVDIDAVAGWLGSYGGEDSSNDISRGTLKSTVSSKLFADN
jgi:hypothetical protein